MRTFITVTITLLLGFNLNANLSLEGSYQGQNLYVQNPPSPDGFGFCVTEVSVNGKLLPININRSAFEIDFSIFNFNQGDHVFVLIEHGDGCQPKVLNPEVLLPKSTFKATEISVTGDTLLEWTATGEQGSLPYIVEQFRWDKWVRVGIVKGTGKSGINTYSYVFVPYPGENKIRVSQIDYTGEKRSSKSTSFQSTVPPMEMTPTKVKEFIQFITEEGNPIESKYEVYDAYGNIVKKGFSKKVDCRNLKDGIYYINYGNKNEKFIKT